MELTILDERNSLTKQLRQCPYDPVLYQDRAFCYERLRFPDLAVGDAYRALLLTDEILDDTGEYHEKAIGAILKHKDRNCGRRGRKGKVDSPSKDVSNNPPKENGYHPIHNIPKDIEYWPEETAQCLAQTSYLILIRSLSRCGCTKSAFEFSNRSLQAFPGSLKLKKAQMQLLDSYHQDQQEQNPKCVDKVTFNPNTDLPDQGSVRRELYPWNTHEPDRFSKSSLDFLNRRLREVAPKCEVRAVSLPLLLENATTTPSLEITQLGLFATTDICPHELVLQESSLLAANNRLHDRLCDACSSSLPHLTSTNPPISCPACDDTIFCSQSCYENSSLYHPALCSKPDFDIIARDPSPTAAANALYTLLLSRAFALSLTQDIHPLSLPETKYLWGDFTPSDAIYIHSTSASAFSTSRHLPFSFADNILAPLHMLEKMDVDIFAELDRCDTWVINTLLAKFRGTASARLSRDGRPEVCAVHPLWSLANHSCAPNVRWEWGAEAGFWARGKGEVVRWGGQDGEKRGGDGGIRKGEEVLNHYSDVDLEVRGRREWLVGPLGGMCCCERCLWEERDSMEKEKNSV